MQRGIVEAQAERHGIGGATRFGNELRLKRRSWRGNARHLARSGAEVVGVNNVDVAVPGNSARSASDRAAEEVELLGHRRGLARLPDHALGKVFAKYALIIFGDKRAFGF